jgi:hypothetical protein
MVASGRRVDGVAYRARAAVGFWDVPRIISAAAGKVLALAEQ